jgi:hypothetical protein
MAPTKTPTPTLENVSDEQIVFWLMQTIYEQKDESGQDQGWRVKGIDNLRIGEPENGWTVDVVVESEAGETLLLEGIYDGNAPDTDNYQDRLKSENPRQDSADWPTLMNLPSITRLDANPFMGDYPKVQPL